MSSWPSSALTLSNRFQWKEDDMDHGLWEALPRDLVLKILAYLPLHEILKFRSVCKSWNSLLDKAWFKKSLIKKSCETPFLITAFKGKTVPEIYVGYTAATHVWHHPFRLFSSQKSEARLLATVGGLVLWLTGEVEMIGGEAVDNRRLLVSNPLIESKRELPSMSTLRKPKEFDKVHATMLLDVETNEYIVFVIHIECNDSKEWDEVSDMKVEVFNSRNNYWESRGTIPKSECKWNSISSLLYNKELYCFITNSLADVEPSLYRIDSCQKNNHSSSFWTKMDFDLRFTGYYVSAYLYHTGARLSIAAVTKRFGMTMIKVSRLQIIQGENRCTVRRPYTLLLTPTDTDFTHSICANQTHIFFMRFPIWTEIWAQVCSGDDKLPALVVIKQQWKDKVGEEELPATSSLQHGPLVPEFDHILQSFLYEPRVDVDV